MSTATIVIVFLDLAVILSLLAIVDALASVSRRNRPCQPLPSNNGYWSNSWQTGLPAGDPAPWLKSPRNGVDTSTRCCRPCVNSG